MHMFVSKKLLSSEATKNLKIDVEKIENLKSANLIDVGTKGKQLLLDQIISKFDQLKFRNGCLKFYAKATKYLLDHLSIYHPILKRPVSSPRKAKRIWSNQCYFRLYDRSCKGNG